MSNRNNSPCVYLKRSFRNLVTCKGAVIKSWERFFFNVQAAKDWLVILQNIFEMIRAIDSMFVSCQSVFGDEFKINSTEFLFMSWKIWELFERPSSFLLFLFWNRTQPIPIKEESTLLKNERFVLGEFSVSSFVTTALFC